MQVISKEETHSELSFYLSVRCLESVNCMRVVQVDCGVQVCVLTLNSHYICLPH